MSTDVVTLTNVRVANTDWLDAPAPAPWVDNHPHPLAVPDDRSALRLAWDDLAVRWLGYSGLVGWGGVLLYWAVVGAHGAHVLALLALVPCAVAWRRNHVMYVSRRAAHRAGRELAW